MAFCCYQKCPVQLDISCSCTKLVHYCSSSHQVTPYCRHKKKSSSLLNTTENSNFFFYFETPFIIKLFCAIPQKNRQRNRSKREEPLQLGSPFSKIAFSADILLLQSQTLKNVFQNVHLALPIVYFLVVFTLLHLWTDSILFWVQTMCVFTVVLSSVFLMYLCIYNLVGPRIQICNNFTPCQAILCVQKQNSYYKLANIGKFYFMEKA